MNNASAPTLQEGWGGPIRLLTVAEIASWARVHPKTVYRWIHDGKLPAIQFGLRTYRVPENAVVEYLRQIGYGEMVFSSQRSEVL